MKTMIAGAAALLLAAPVPAPAADCFAACVATKPRDTQDHFVLADGVRQCRDMCMSQALEKLRRDGLYAAYAGCEAKPLSRDEFRAVRAANPSWQQQFNIFTWEIRNVLPDKLLTEIEVSTQDMNLSTISMTAAAIISPDETGTFVVPDFFDGYPAVRYATKVASISACELPPR